VAHEKYAPKGDLSGQGSKAARGYVGRKGKRKDCPERRPFGAEEREMRTPKIKKIKKEKEILIRIS
jgi:hypothetical protein